MDGIWGLDGWRWVFVVGGLPAVVLGVAFFLAVTDRPDDARWLTGEQRTWLTATLPEEEAQRATAAPAGHRAALRNKFAVTAVGLGSPMSAFVAVTLATMAAQTANPLFWSLPTTFLAGTGAASGLALTNSFGNAAGFVSPYAVGWIQQASGGNDGLSMTVMIVTNVLAMVVIAGLWLSARRRAVGTAEPPRDVAEAPGVVAAD